MKAKYRPPGGAQDGSGDYDHDDQHVRIVNYTAQGQFVDDVAGGRFIGGFQQLTMEWVIKPAASAATDQEKQDSINGKVAVAKAFYDAEQAASVVGGALTVELDDGDTSTHSLSGLGSNDVGVRVREFSCPEGDGVEMATRRTCRVTLTKGAPFDSQANQSSTPVSPGDDFAENTGFGAHQWGSGPGFGDFGGSLSDTANQSESQTYDWEESYEVSGGETITGIVPLPTGAPYTWQKYERDVRVEKHTIRINATNSYYAGIPTAILTGTGVTRKTRHTRKRGKPPTYTTEVTWTKRS